VSAAPTRVIGLSAPDVGAREEELVLEALRSGTLGLGPFLRRFESDFASFVGTRHATAVSSGTAGLHLAALLAGIGPGDEVITSPTSFVASANCILYTGATPVFVDVDRETLNIDPDAIEAAITPRTRAILPVHIFGYPCAIDRINEIARRHGLTVVEDAAEAVGTIAAGRRVGSHGNLAVFAFYPNKQITTGEGGMVTTDFVDLQASLQSLSNQGRSDNGEWLEHDRLGYNYRLDEMSAAVGVAQVERIDAILARRAAVAARYGELLADVPGVGLPTPDANGDVRSWFVYVVKLDPEIDRNLVMARLRDRGVASKPYLPVVHLQPYFRALGHGDGECPVAEHAARRTLALPFHTRLDPRDQEQVVETLADVLASM
jgi:perosamine synthetase